MLIESEEFDRGRGPPSDWQDSAIFLYCKFRDLAIEGSGADGALMGCDLINIDWYWGSFSGTSFRGCRFLECRFERCRFVLDNMGGACIFDDCSFVECVFDQCEFVLDSPKGRLVFQPTRWYGRTQTRCAGLEGLF